MPRETLGLGTGRTPRKDRVICCIGRLQRREEPRTMVGLLEA